MHVSSVEEANDKITAFKTTMSRQFCCVRADRDFGRTGNFVLNFLQFVQQLMAGCDSTAKRRNG